MLAYSSGRQALKSSAPHSFKYTCISVGLHTQVRSYTHTRRKQNFCISTFFWDKQFSKTANTEFLPPPQASTTDMSKSSIEQTSKGCVHNFLLLMVGFECGCKLTDVCTEQNKMCHIVLVHQSSVSCSFSLCHWEMPFWDAKERPYVYGCFV